MDLTLSRGPEPTPGIRVKSASTARFVKGVIHTDPTRPRTYGADDTETKVLDDYAEMRRAQLNARRSQLPNCGIPTRCEHFGLR